VAWPAAHEAQLRGRSRRRAGARVRAVGPAVHEPQRRGRRPAQGRVGAEVGALASCSIPSTLLFCKKNFLMLHKCFGVLRHVIYDVATCLILRFGLASSLPDRRPIGGGGGDGVSMGRMGGHLWLCLSWYRGGVGGGAAASAGGRRPSASR